MNGCQSLACLFVLGCVLAWFNAGPGCSNSGQTGSPADISDDDSSPTEPGPESGGAGAPPVDMPDASGGQTGAPPGEADCLDDADCVPQLTEWTEPVAASISLVSARCAHVDPSNDPLPVCHCTTRVEPSESSGRAPFEATFYAGHRGFPQERGCSEFGRIGDCLYCADEFPGCHLESPEPVCAGICEDLVGRVAEAWQATYTVTVRLARCRSYHCETVLEVDGRCFVGGIPPDSAGYDCSLSDEELLERGMSFEPTCPEPSEYDCATVEDCPGGLACNSGVCGPCPTDCSRTWTYPDGDPALEVCEGDSACASGEGCVMGVCVPEANLECRDSYQCPEAEACVLSGVDFEATRGNATTRAFCVPRGSEP